MVYSKIIDAFREEINEYRDFIIQKYAKSRDKNHWNCICSAMDWMTVASRYIDNKKHYSENIDDMSMEIYLYISAVDIIWEAIKQLHRVIANPNTVPFSDDSQIFKDERLSIDDNEHFKHIRAAFGAHPVNLNDDVKRFASWPTSDVHHEYDLAVYLYSSDKTKEDIVFGIKYQQLKAFLDIRVNYLENLLGEIKGQYKNYNTEMRKRKIEVSENPLEMLNILKLEANERFNNDYYDVMISKLIGFYTTNITAKENYGPIEAFKSELLKIIEEIHYNLQNMRCKELKTDFTGQHSWCPKGLSYSYSKLAEQVVGHGYRPLYGEGKILEFMKTHLTINENMSSQELYLLANVSFFLHHKKLRGSECSMFGRRR